MIQASRILKSTKPVPSTVIIGSFFKKYLNCTVRTFLEKFLYRYHGYFKSTKCQPLVTSILRKVFRNLARSHLHVARKPFCNFSAIVVHRASERGARGDNDPGPMEFRGPMGLKGPMIGPNGLYRAHGNGRSKTFFRFFGNHLETPKKIVPFCREDLFFLEIT